MRVIGILLFLIFCSDMTFAKQMLPIEVEGITEHIQAKTTGQKGRSFYYCSNSVPCSTEDVVREYYKNKNYNVMRAEVAVWQGFFALAFYDEIFYNHDFILSADLPQNFFSEDELYLSRKTMYDKKYEFLLDTDIYEFMNSQLRKYGNVQTRILRDGQIEGFDNCIAYFYSDTVQKFLKRVDNEIFANIVYRIAKNPNKYRAGIADFVVWNEDEMFCVEVKRDKEKIRQKQIEWALFMLRFKIPIKIIRVDSI